MYENLLDNSQLLQLPQWLPMSVYAWLVQQTVFHLIGFIFECCDRSKSNSIRRLKVGAIDGKPYMRLLPRVLFNQGFVLLPCMALSQWLGICFTSTPHQLSLTRFVLSLPLMAIGHDLVQYFSHRYLLHQPIVPLVRLLKHSIHHSTGATKAISACYMSLPDFFLEVVLPYLVPLALVGGGGSDALFHSLVAGLGAVGGLYEHSGYDFSSTFIPSEGQDLLVQRLGLGCVLKQLLDNRAHREHHIRANVSFSDGFGSPGLCDTLFGTRWDLVARIRAKDVEKEWRQQRAKAASGETTWRRKRSP